MNPHVESIKPVWDDLKYCFISSNRLKRVAKEMAQRTLKNPSWRGPTYQQEDNSQMVIQFFGVESAINFCFTDYVSGRSCNFFYKNTIWHGSSALTPTLSRALDDGIDLLDPFVLANMKLSDASYIFRPHTVSMPMIDERVNNMRNCGQTLLESGWETFERLFRECDYRLFNNGNGIVEHLTRTFDCFRDEV